MSDLNLTADPRTLVGRKVRQLRRGGLVPVVVYGRVDKPVNLQVDSISLEKALHHGGMSQLVQVTVSDGQQHNVLIRDTHRDPVTAHLLHADFYAVSMTETQEADVALVAVGKPKEMAGNELILQNLDTITVEALPADIPASIEVDLTKLTHDAPILVSDLVAPAGVTLLADLDDVVFSIVASRVDAEEEAAEEALEYGDDEDLSEPEVIARGKDEDDE
ncbi:MAG: 50S ribosomal protein L25 [Caldilineaceae bacterium]|nr:50S ribosomal protein L25 [Caldilineaceae bacterium]MBP8108076.1 50S ribosomal protein L25 [Caldilineaceae bacterium]MBP8124590.1 50S ribosomal protein L25 [Caldilineaceae bacterium]MBP9071020.1 50S ribosomal protein L25 [Caldilineaceae bacterium]